jgi:bifunctional oligoribonuclease and PAP phosphatase NrnA
MEKVILLGYIIMRIKSLNKFCKILYDRLSKGKNILIVSHTSPDPDCLFSQLALFYILKDKFKNKKFFLFNKDYNSQKDVLIEFFPQLKWVKNKLEDLNNFDLIIGIEITDQKRFGFDEDFEFINQERIFIIDHHKVFNVKNSIYYLEENADCCSFIIYKIGQILKYKMDEDFRSFIMMGIIGDTVGFRYIKNKETFYCLSKIFDENIKIYKLYKLIFGFDIKLLKKFNEIFQNFKFYRNLNLILLKFTDTKRVKKVKTLIEFFRLFKKVNTVIFLSKKNNLTYGHLRSDTIDVSKIAKYFGGGGHKYSSGFSTEEDINKVEKKILKFLNDLK